MFCTRYFCDRYFAPRYFPKIGAAPPDVIRPTGSARAAGPIGSARAAAPVATVD